ncbi:MAG: glycosyltransferase family 2 protein [Bacteroidales bacterium]|nr:glycosyltransferase family 2 protein [Bacteroidales bacterium]
MEHKYNYTVIVPHYNMPKLLQRALQSIPRRDDIQVIVIDDCSPCANNLNTLVPDLSRTNLMFFSTGKNSGVGVARNIGLDNAEGEWIICVDSDDLLVSNAFEIFDRYLKSDSESIIFNSKSVMSDDLAKPSKRSPRNQEFDDYLSGKNDDLRYTPAQPWGRMVRRELIERHHIRFPEVRYSEDRFFSIAVSALTDKFLPVNEVVYIVTERSDSNTSTLFSNKKYGLQEAKERFYEAVRTHKMLLTVVDKPNTRDLVYYRNLFFKNHPFRYLIELWGHLTKYYFVYWFEITTMCKLVINKIKRII